VENPKLTVLMSVYNSELYVKHAIDSILNQTFGDFEFIIFNDGSSDRSADIIRSFSDPRIRFIDYKENSGRYTERLNEGIRIAGGKYIARMDHDDIAFPKRLGRQFKFMEDNPDIGACGANIVTIGAVEGRVIRFQTEYEMIKSTLFFNGALAHPTIIMRKSVLEKNNIVYDSNFYPIEDYKLYLDISRYSKLGNIPEVLLKYRLHPDQMSKVFYAAQRAITKKIYKQQFQEMGVTATDKELEVHSSLWDASLARSSYDINETGEWLLKLRRLNRQKKIFCESAFSKILTQKWFYFCMARHRFGVWARKVFIEWPLFRGVHLNIIESARLFFMNSVRYIKRIKTSFMS